MYEIAAISYSTVRLFMVLQGPYFGQHQYTPPVANAPSLPPPE